MYEEVLSSFFAFFLMEIIRDDDAVLRAPQFRMKMPRKSVRLCVIAAREIIAPHAASAASV